MPTSCCGAQHHTEGPFPPGPESCQRAGPSQNQPSCDRQWLRFAKMCKFTQFAQENGRFADALHKTTIQGKGRKPSKAPDPVAEKRSRKDLQISSTTALPCGALRATRCSSMAVVTVVGSFSTADPCPAN